MPSNQYLNLQKKDVMNLQNIVKLLKLNQNFLFFMFALFCSSLLTAQSATYYVLIKKSKLSPSCKVHTDFKTLTLSSKFDSKKRNKIIDVYKNSMNPDEDSTIDEKEFYVNKTDYVVVYEYVFKSIDCPSKTSKYIKAFQASSKEKVQSILQKKLETSFLKDRYIRHKILLETQPFSLGEASLLKNAENFLLKQTKKDSLKKAKKATTIGVRG